MVDVESPIIENDDNTAASILLNDTHQTPKKQVMEVHYQPGNKIKKVLQENLLLILTILAVVLGFVIGAAFKSYSLSIETIRIIKFPGDILMGMLKMLIVPLIISCLISGISQLDPQSSGKIGTRALLYYVVTTITAVFLGIFLVIVIHPGSTSIKSNPATSRKKVMTSNSLDAFFDLLTNMFPENIVRATFQSSKTAYEEISPKRLLVNGSIIEKKILRKRIFYDNMNMLGIIIFCTAFGIVLSRLGTKAQMMINFFSILNDIFMQMVKLVMWYSPIGIMCLISGQMLMVADIGETLRQVGMYVTTVLTGLSIHLLIILPGLYFICTRKNPFKFLKGMLQAFVTALGTGSSTATLPITFDCLENKLNIDGRVTRFVLPIGATINMDGTALYEAVAAIFIAQVNGVSLNFVQILAISITATLASIGAATVPSAGLVTMVIVLSSVGLPIEDISLIASVDWFLDRFRTATNVMGDSFGSGIVHHFSKRELEHIDENVAQHDKEFIEMVYNNKGSGEKKESFLQALSGVRYKSFAA